MCIYFVYSILYYITVLLSPSVSITSEWRACYLRMCVCVCIFWCLHNLYFPQKRPWQWPGFYYVLQSLHLEIWSECIRVPSDNVWLIWINCRGNGESGCAICVCVTKWSIPFHTYSIYISIHIHILYMRVTYSITSTRRNDWTPQSGILSGIQIEAAILFWRVPSYVFISPQQQINKNKPSHTWWCAIYILFFRQSIQTSNVFKQVENMSHHFLFS